MSGFRLPIRQVVNGPFTAWLAEERSVPVVSLSWAWKGGTGLDPEGGEGTASLLAGLLTEGAGDLDATTFSDALRDSAIQLSFSADRDGFSGSFRCLTEALPEAVRLAALAMSAPRFDADAVERVRARAAAAQRRSLETPRGLAGRAFWQALFPGHPSAREAGGTPDSLAAITVEGIRAARAAQLRRGGLTIAAAGDISPDQLAPLLRDLFGALPEGEPPALPPLPPPQRFGVRVIPFAGPQSHMLFGQAGLPVRDPDWEAAQVMLRVLGGGGFSSRLMEEVRVRRGLTYGIGAGLSVLMGQGLITGSVATENARAGETLAVLRAEWARMAESGPTEGEAADALAYFAGSLPLQLSDTRSIAGTLLSMQQNGRPMDWLDRREERLRAITRERLAAVARRLLDAEGLSAVVVGQPVGL
ncbi:MAG: pitrilysin family protein [Acetobacteraceae bacterium]|nr:pitrilysin family protein [Acetobacteraceae bacterium]